MARREVIALVLLCATLAVSGVRHSSFRVKDSIEAKDGYALNLEEEPQSPSDIAAAADGLTDMGEDETTAAADGDDATVVAVAPLADDASVAASAPDAAEAAAPAVAAAAPAAAPAAAAAAPAAADGAAAPPAASPVVAAPGMAAVPAAAAAPVDPAAAAATAAAVAMVSVPGTKSVDMKGGDAGAAPAVVAPTALDVNTGNYVGSSSVLNRGGDWKPPSSQYINLAIVPTPVVNPAATDDMTMADTTVVPMNLPAAETGNAVFVPQLAYTPDPSDALLNAGMGESPESVLQEANEPTLQADMKQVAVPETKAIKKTSKIIDIMDHQGDVASDDERLEIGTGVTDDFRILPAGGEGDAGSAPDTDRGIQIPGNLGVGDAPVAVATVQAAPPAKAAAPAPAAGAIEAVTPAAAAAGAAALDEQDDGDDSAETHYLY